MKISIIIPVYNSEKYLSKCLDSIINQTFSLKNIEVIIINDGSTDNSEKIIMRYEKKLNIIYKKQKNEGQSSARNKGIKLAKGKYLTFIDSDDYIDKKMLSIMYKEADNNNLDIITCDLAKVKGNSIIHIKDRISNDETRNFILTKTGPCNMLIKKEIIDKYNFKFPTNIKKYEDIAVIPVLGLKENIKIKHLDTVLYYYNDNDNSVMNINKYTPKLNDIFIAMNLLLDKAQKENNYKKYSSEIEYLFIRHFLMSAGLRYIRLGDPEKKVIDIIKIMNNIFPNWKDNFYYKNSNIKLKITANLILKNRKLTIKLLDKIRRKDRVWKQ